MRSICGSVHADEAQRLAGGGCLGLSVQPEELLDA
jgi:hypothetical protein